MPSPSAHGSSNALVPTPVPAAADPRAHYLARRTAAPPPCVAHAPFVPAPLVAHLLRRKKDAAIAVKYVPGDEITNMEGAAHTYVVPACRAYMHGDAVFRRGHDVARFPTLDGHQQARPVVVSALVQPDFENDEVLLQLAMLREAPTQGEPLPSDFTIPSAAAKRDDAVRAAYDERLRRHLVAHLTPTASLPGWRAVADTALTVAQARALIESAILTAPDLPAAFADSYITLRPGVVLSLALLFHSAAAQVRAELAVLGRLCGDGAGYAYTWDPPAIFARRLDAWLLTLVQVAALRHVAETAAGALAGMRVFAFNDYAHPGGLRVLRAALAGQQQVRVVAKRELFAGPGGTYVALEGTEAAVLVLHNNSDAFGQNIESEGAHGSLDGVIGANSSAAASLHRERADLLDRCFC